MKINKFKLLLGLIITCVLTNSFSQEKPTDTIKINEVVITGTPVKINRNNVPMSVSVISKEQIEQTGESSLFSAISGKVPGLFVSERGITGFGVSTGSAGQISMRGIGSNPTTGVLVLIDGHPQFMGIMGHPLPDTYVSSDAERVEIIRGPASVLYGTNAMGGVMNIITRKQKREGFTGNARILFGSYNTQKYMASGGYRKNKWSIFTSINHDKTDGHRDSSDFKISNGYLKLGYAMNDYLNFNADVSISNFVASDPGPDTLNAKAGTNIDITRGYASLGMDNEFGRNSGSLKFFYNFGKHNISDGFRSNDVNYGVNLVESYKLANQSYITLGADYLDYGGKARNIKAMGGEGITFTDTTVYETGIFGYIQQQFFDKLIINGGLRMHYHKVYGTEFIPSVGLAYNISSITSIRGSISKGYRSPTIRELFIKQWGANPNLMPENVMNYEIGLNQTSKNRVYSIDLTGFVIQGDNMITTVPGKGLTNSGTVENIGIELALNIQPVKLLHIDAAYSFTHMKFPVYATPEQQLYFGAGYRLKKITFIANTQIVNNLDTDPSSFVALSSYAVVNLKMNYRVHKFVSVTFSIDNLLNTHYEINRYYTMPGTTFFGGINLNY